MYEANHKVLVEAYLKAVKERDLSQCLSFYTEDASVKFLFSTYHGKQAIEKWHKDRFAANLQLLSLEGISVHDNTVVLSMLVSSNRLKSFGIKSVKATGVFLLQDSQIREAKFTPQKGVASHMDWQFQ